MSTSTSTTQRQDQQKRANHLRDMILAATETSKQTRTSRWIQTCKGRNYTTQQDAFCCFVFNRNVNANLYVNEVLTDIVVPFMQDNFPEGNGILQQDGAKPHAAIVTPQFIADYNISLLNWASMSPDMSLIEHVWDELKRRVYDRPHHPVNVQQLKYAVIEEWNAIPQALH